MKSEISQVRNFASQKFRKSEISLDTGARARNVSFVFEPDWAKFAKCKHALFLIETQISLCKPGIFESDKMSEVHCIEITFIYISLPTHAFVVIIKEIVICIREHECNEGRSKEKWQDDKYSERNDCVQQILPVTAVNITASSLSSLWYSLFQ